MASTPLAQPTGCMCVLRCAVTLVLAIAPQLPAQAFERFFYYTDREDSYRSLVAHIDQITVLGPQVYTVDSLGLVFGSLDRRVVALAKQHGVRLMPLVVNEGFHQPSLRRLLSDTAARARAVRSLVELCRTNGYWGIQFDIENLNLQDRDRFTDWYSDAAKALHAAGFTISVALVHQTEDGAGSTGYHRFLADSWRTADIAVLARAGDFISVMSYDQHTRRTPPGPVSGMPWMTAVVDYFLRMVPPQKLSLGIPLYGDHWFARYDGTVPERTRTVSESVSWTWGSGLAERHGATVQWDAEQQVPFAHYENGGTFEWLYLEDARSFRAKLALARARNLRGFSAWVLGPEDPKIWDVK
jgi:spore germination protein YaaH